MASPDITLRFKVPATFTMQPEVVYTLNITGSQVEVLLPGIELTPMGSVSGQSIQTVLNALSGGATLGIGADVLAQIAAAVQKSNGDTGLLASLLKLIPGAEILAGPLEELVGSAIDQVQGTIGDALGLLQGTKVSGEKQKDLDAKINQLEALLAKVK